MSRHEDFLLEIQTEELPPKVLTSLGTALKQEMEKHLQKANLSHGASQYYATPRRLALFIEKVAAEQAAQMVERKGPALNAAYDKEGKPTPACLGFARSCGVSPEQLTILKNQGGEWVGYVEKMPGKPTIALLPAMAQQALAALPIPKRMRWGSNTESFIRPVHSAILLFGKNVVETNLIGQHADRLTSGHRFHHPASLKISQPKNYASTLEKKGWVIANFAKRRTLIHQQAQALVREKLGEQAKIIFQDDLLDEVTGLVEWPVAICGHFDKHFLNLPKEVLISSMQDHQRYFPIEDAQGKLLAHFVAAINIESKDLSRVVLGNERVLKARLSDAAFFYETDRKQSLENRGAALKGIIFQAKLGTLDDKTQRLIRLAQYLAKELKENEALAIRAAQLAKADLTTGMVGEFPELQGVMGFYYALHDKENPAVAQAIVDHYRPRFSGDVLPQEKLGCLIALADRIDTLVGVFGINQNPTGDKDPFGLRRAALGVLRILIEKQLDLDLLVLLNHAVSYYGNLENKETAVQVLRFVLDRLKGLYQEQGVEPQVFAAVMAMNVSSPYDIYQRMLAVQAFKKLPEAEALTLANKRVSNILAQSGEKFSHHQIDSSLFENEAEKELAQALEATEATIKTYTSAQYTLVMIELSKLRTPIDHFFDQVMVMTEDRKVRENRLILLNHLRALFLRVADIALLK